MEVARGPLVVTLEIALHAPKHAEILILEVPAGRIVVVEAAPVNASSMNIFLQNLHENEHHHRHRNYLTCSNLGWSRFRHDEGNEGFVGSYLTNVN